jgi:hypothetical protein
MGRRAFMLALVVSSFVSAASAQQRATPTLTSEDLLDRSSDYSAPASIGREPSSSTVTPVGGLYQDPSGAFSLNFPSRNWRLNTKSLDKGRLNDLRVFRKVEGDGVASATASIYVVSPAAGLSVQNAAGLDGAGRSTLAQTLAARFLSSTSNVIMTSAGKSEDGPELQVLADQTVAGRASVRAIIYAFEHQGKLFVVVCRAPVESFDAQAREFFTIAQSLASSVKRSSSKAAL